MDLEDGRAKTLKELRADWAEWYSVAEIDEYWAKRCRPLSGFRGAGSDKALPQQRPPKSAGQSKARHEMLDPALAWGIPRSEWDEQVEPGPLVREAKSGYQWQDGRGRWHAFGASAVAVISEALVRGELSARVALDTGRRYSVSLSLLQRRSALADCSNPAPFNDATVAEAPVVTDGLLATASLAPAPDFSANCQQTRLTLKVSLGRETCRFALAWPRDLCAKEVLAVVRESVTDGFGPSLAREGFTLHYLDDDGDFCTLVEHTLHDCLSFAAGSILRLQLRTCTASDSDVGGAVFPEEVCPKGGVPNKIDAPPTSLRVTPRVSIHDEYERDWAIVDASSGAASEVEVDL